MILADSNVSPTIFHSITVDWLVEKQDVSPNVSEVMKGLAEWSGVAAAGRRKLKGFDSRIIEIALDHLDKANNLPV